MKTITLIIFFIIASIVTNLIEGSKRNNTKMKKQNGYRPQAAAKTAMNKAPIEVELEAKDEGKLFEDKNKAGSLNYFEADKADEGIQTESARRDVIAIKDTISEIEESKNSIFDISDLQKGVVLNEVLGLPRSLKRNIR